MDEQLQRLVRIEEKLDAHLERTIRNEADITWIKGAVRGGAALLATLLSGLVAVVWSTIKGH